jgi:methylmalonyl-CoA mutase cobalamin-binding subunit
MEARIREAAKIGPESVRGVAPAPRDRAMEVTWTGVRQMIAAPAGQEDIPPMAVSVISGASSGGVSRVTHLPHDRGLDVVLVIAEGSVPPDSIVQFTRDAAASPDARVET